MKKVFAVVAACGIALMVASCSVTLPVCATSNPVGSKVGEASTHKVFGFWTGDRGIATAAKNGGIKMISTVDEKIAGNKCTTIVTGE